MPGRKYGTLGRYGFNGKEKANEIGNDNYDFGARILDTRLGGRWFGIDPKASKHPGESPYVFCSNNPIIYVDPDGEDKIYTVTVIGKDGKTTVMKKVDKDFFIYKKVDVPGFGNNRYYKSDVNVNVTIDLSGKTTKATYSEQLGNRTDASQADYIGVKIKNFFGSFSSGSTDISRGSQPGGMTLTSEFSENVDGPKTDATKGSSGSVNIDLIMAGFGAVGLSSKGLAFTMEDLPEWINLAKDLIEANEELKKKNSANGDNSTPQIEPGKPANSIGIDPVFKKPGNVVYRRDGGLKTEVIDSTRAQTTDKPATDTFPKTKRNS